MKYKDYKELIVWQKSIKLVEEIYKISSQLPKEERFGIISQIQRASISIPSNIAEGSRRFTQKSFKHFLRIAFGSASELETQLIILKRLPFGKNLDYTRADALLLEILKILNKLTH